MVTEMVECYPHQPITFKLLRVFENDSVDENPNNTR